LLVARVVPFSGRAPEKLLHAIVITRMGEGLGDTGLIGEAGQQRALDAIHELLLAAAPYSPEGVCALGMEAFRRASNGAVLAARIQADTGVPVRILAGREEAALGREGVVRALGVPDPLLLVDIGGGSTELALTDPPWEVSVPLGAVVATEGWLRGDPPGAETMSTLRAATHERLAAAYAEAPRTGAPRLVGVGGTVTTYAAIDLVLDEYDSARVHQHVLSRARVAEITQRLAALPLAERRQVPGLHPARAPVILGGGVLLETAMEVSASQSLTVSEANLLHAYVVEQAEEAVSRQRSAQH